MIEKSARHWPIPVAITIGFTHWTDLLAYRRFPPHAKVIDDLACIGCGYNLRGSRAGGQCPECGRDVGDSLFILAKPVIVANGLRGMGKGSLANLAILLNLLPTAQVWPLIVSLTIIAIGSAFRLAGAWQVRFRSAIDRLPLIAGRINLLWLICLAEFITVIAWLAIVLAVAKVPSWQTAAAQNAIRGFALVWIVLAYLNMFASGWFALSLAIMLHYVWTVIELHVQIAVVLVSTFTLICAFAVLAFVQTTFIVMLVCVGLAILLYCAAVVATSICLLHVANGAEQETESWEEVLDLHAPEPAQERSPHSHRDDSPPIRLEP